VESNKLRHFNSFEVFDHTGTSAPYFAVAVKDKKPWCRFERKRSPQMPHSPLAGRVLGNVEMKNPPSIVANDE
jgi:hypothetical protein